MRYTIDLKTKEITEFPDDPPSMTQAEIDAQRQTQIELLADFLVNSPSLSSAIEEFSGILQTASIPVPQDIQLNIKNRIKTKLGG